MKKMGKGELRKRLIVCDYLDDRVAAYLGEHHSADVLTLFKEPITKYRGSTIIFVDDILKDTDYEQIDERVNGIMRSVGDGFSNYLNVDGYDLFQYLQLQGARSLAKACKYKYAVDKIVAEREKSDVFFFSSELAVLEWLKQDSRVTCLACSAPIHNAEQMKSQIKRWVRKCKFIPYMLVRLFADHRHGPNHILWLGGRSVQSTLLHELKVRGFKIFLFLNDLGRALNLVRRGLRYDVLPLRDRRKFNEQWHHLEQRYLQGLGRIASRTGLRGSLLELLLQLNKNSVRNLLHALCSLDNNKAMLSLLFLEQSVIGVQALAVDYFDRHGLPSLEVLHGIPCGLPIEVGRATKTAVCGQRDKDFLVDHGVDTTKIVITGSPRYDTYFDANDRHKTSEFLLLILGWILFVPSSQSHQKIFEQVMSMIRLVKTLNNEQVVIKLHLAQSKEELTYVQHLVSTTESQKQVTVTKNGDLTDLLRRAKIVFTYSSSAGVEALLMRKPLIVLDFFPGRKVEYEKYGGCLVATRFQELVKVTKQIVNDVDGYQKRNVAKLERTKRYFSGDLDGKASKNIAVLCREMIKNRSK